jgi:hypothetical protein
VNEPERQALLELFAVVDGVCTEPDLFNAERLNAGLGRIYRQWRITRDVFAHTSYLPLRQRIPSEATGEKASQGERTTPPG